MSQLPQSVEASPVLGTPLPASAGDAVVSLEDIGPELSLWSAVIVQLIEDALDYAKHGDDRHGFRLEAHLELNRPGAMLHRLCALAGVDRELVLDTYRRRLAAMGDKGRPVSEASQAVSARFPFLS